MTSCKCTSHDLYFGGVSDNDKCVSDAMESVCMTLSLSLSLSFLLVCFKLSSGDFPPACGVVLAFFPVSPSSTLPFPRFAIFPPSFLVRDDPSSDDLLLYVSGRCGE